MTTTVSLHSKVSAFINSFLFYFEKNNIDVKGVTGSIVVGVCAGFLMVVVLSVYPGQPLGIYNEVDETDHFADKDPPSEDTRELQKIMPGISKAQIQQILFFTQQQRVKLNHGHKNIDLNDSVISIFTVIKMILFAGLLSWLVFVLNRDYGNIVTIWFVRTFPRESSTFGLSLKNEL